MAVPIIFIHRNDSDYLAYTLAQAQASNPESPVVMIGDSSNRYAGVDHYLIADYCDSADQFGQIYRHLSTNLASYECFCFQRWFILQEFIQSQGLEACLYLDSDVMLYANATQEHQRLQTFDLALTEDVPSCVYINRPSAIVQFCDLITELYTNPITLERLEATFQQQLRHSIATSISDMYAFQAYRRRYPHQVGELCAIVDGYSYDARLTEGQGYVRQADGIKQVTLIDGEPVGHLASGDPVRFQALHFQGLAKHFIRQFFTGDAPAKHLTESPISQADGQEPPATAIAEPAPPVEPDSAEAHYTWGNAWMQQGQPTRAIPYFEAAIALQPDLIGAYINLGGAYVQLGQAEAAIHCYHQAIHVDPTSSVVYGNLGYAYAQAGQYSLSTRYIALSNALEMLNQHPTWAETHRNLGLAYLRFDNLDGAIASFQTALQIDPDFAEAQADLRSALEHQTEIQIALQQQQIQAILRPTNWLIVPDWTELDSLYPSLIEVIEAVLWHPDRATITLLIDTSNAGKLEVGTILNELVFSILLQAELDISDETAPEFYPLPHLPTATWAAIAPHLQGRIILAQENPEVLNLPILQTLSTLTIHSSDFLQR